MNTADFPINYFSLTLFSPLSEMGKMLNNNWNVHNLQIFWPQHHLTETTTTVHFNIYTKIIFSQFCSHVLSWTCSCHWLSRYHTQRCQRCGKPLPSRGSVGNSTMEVETKKRWFICWGCYLEIKSFRQDNEKRLWVRL